MKSLSLPQRPIRAGMCCLLPALCLAGCARPDLPRNLSAYEVIPAVADSEGSKDSDYVLGPADVISLTVLNEPDLSLKEVQVTTGGNISLPLIGQVKASGLTPDRLAQAIAARLSERMLRNPDVTVNLATAVSQKVVVEGSVTKPGIYPLQGKTTLLGAIAMAEGTTRVSALREVVILRTINDKPMGAVFDIGMIRRGELPDPELVGGDTVVVGFSALKSAWRDILTTAPLITVFRAYR